MKERPKQRASDILEDAIDTFGLEQVLHTLAEICYGKETHVSETWGDVALAERWSRAGIVITDLANKDEVSL